MRFIFGLVHNPPALRARAPTSRASTRRSWPHRGAEVEEGVRARRARARARPTCACCVFMGALGEALCGYLLVGRPELTHDARGRAGRHASSTAGRRMEATMTAHLAARSLALVAPAAAARRAALARGGGARARSTPTPTCARASEDLALLRGAATRRWRTRCPSSTCSGTALRYRDPSLLNSSSFDAFPPELRDSLRPVPANLFEATAQLRQTLFSFKLGTAIRAARLAATLGRRGGPARRGRRSPSTRSAPTTTYLLEPREGRRSAEKAVRQKEKHLEMAQNRRAAGVATELDVLRSQVDLENQRAAPAAPAGPGRPRARATLNAVMVQPIDAPDRADRHAWSFAPLEITLEEVVREALAEPARGQGGRAERARSTTS